MTRTKRLGIWSGAAALLGTLGLLPSLPAVAASDTQMEEVVVTGSFIRRDSFDSASPLTVVDQTEIANNATPNLGEVMVNQTFNYGSDFQTNTYAARPQIGTSTAANLRGLGANATLNLIDGKRTIQQNFNNAIPQIAIERIDILKDGASATYGTDAVAGAVNIITRKDFSGSKFSAFYQQDKDDDFHGQQYEFMAGSDTEDGHITVAASYKKRTTLEQTERPDYLRGGFERSGTGNPGRWLVPVRDAAGNIIDTQTRRDPGCGASLDASPAGTDIGRKGNFLTGDPRNAVEFAVGLPVAAAGALPQFGAQECGFHFGETWNFINPDEQWSAWINFRHQFTDNLSNEIDIQASRLTTDSRGSPQNPGGRTEEFPVVRGDHPGNPFRAMDANGAPLFAQDADGDGIPDRDPNTDANNDGVPDVIVAGTDGTAPNVVPFNEDVDVVALRAMGKIGLLPGANQPTGLNADGSNLGNATFDVINYRVVDTMTYRVPNSSWEVDMTGIFQRNHLVLDAKNTSQSALVDGLKGELQAVPQSEDPNTSYWNPFATQALNCVNLVCQHTGTPDFANSVEVLDAINILTNNVTDTEFWSANIVGNGDLMEMPAGILRAAFGAEYRKVTVEDDLDDARNRCDWHEGGCAFDWEESQDVWGAYYEFSIPAHETLEVTLAGRYEDYGGDVGDSFDPKFSFLWQPIDILSIRASWSSAFIAPTLTQRFEAENCGLQTMEDWLTGDFSGSFRSACGEGNPNLQPEEADTFNIGFSLDLLNGDLTLGVDYANYDFEDRISQETANNVLDASYNRFLQAGNTPGDPTDIANWIANNEPKIVRDVTGEVQRVTIERLNAQEMEHTAWDFYSRYNLSLNNWGDFVFGLNATLADEYTYDLGTVDIDATGNPSQVAGDGVGNQNEQVSEIPPMPEWRINGTINWLWGNHAARIRARWIDGFDLQFNSSGLQNLHLARGGELKVDDITYIDINYKYTFDRLLGDRSTTIELGANNVTDEFPDPFFNLGGLETFVHDIRGRMWYVRLNQDI